MIKTQDRESTTRRDIKKSGQPYWWTPEIEEQRKTCNTKRREIIRMRKRTFGTQELENAEQEHKILTTKYKKLLKKSKNDTWKKLCEEIDTDIWGEGYKIAMKKMGVSPYELEEEEKKKIVKHLFPRSEDFFHKSNAVPADSLFTIDELRQAAERIKTRKAPGPDNYLPEAIKGAVEVIPGTLLEALNKLLKGQRFPTALKRRRSSSFPNH